MLDYTNLFTPNDYEKNYKIILIYFQWLEWWKKIYFVVSGKNKRFKNPKISYTFGKTLVLFIISSKCKNENVKIFKEAESIEIWKILGSVENM